MLFTLVKEKNLKRKMLRIFQCFQKGDVFFLKLKYVHLLVKHFFIIEAKRIEALYTKILNYKIVKYIKKLFFFFFKKHA